MVSAATVASTPPSARVSRRISAPAQSDRGRAGRAHRPHHLPIDRAIGGCTRRRGPRRPDATGVRDTIRRMHRLTEASPGVPVVDPDQVCDARTVLADAAQLQRAAGVLDALGEPNRLGILLALRHAGDLCVSDLAVAVGMSDSAVSHALRLLRAHGMVSAHRQGRLVRYRVTGELTAAVAGRCLRGRGRRRRAARARRERPARADSPALTTAARTGAHSRPAGGTMAGGGRVAAVSGHRCDAAPPTRASCVTAPRCRQGESGVRAAAACGGPGPDHGRRRLLRRGAADPQAALQDHDGDADPADGAGRVLLPDRRGWPSRCWCCPSRCPGSPYWSPTTGCRSKVEQVNRYQGDRRQLEQRDHPVIEG